jgi:phytol kinase
MMPDVLLDLIPSPGEALRGAAMGAAAFAVAASLAAGLRRRGWRDGDTRKIFHFVIFTTAAAVRVSADIGVVAAYGAVVATAILVCVWRGEGNPLFEALARQSDRPRRALHVVVPLCATAAGGVTAHLLAGALAPVAILVGGWGDAVGEPVGIRWGRHRFQVPTVGGVRATRSVEGTAAVLLASFAAAWAGYTFLGVPHADAAARAAAIALVATAVESGSPHGLDNFTVMAASAAACRWLG